MNNFIKGAKLFAKHFLSFWKEKKYPNIDKTARVDESVKVYNPSNLIMEEKTNIDAGAVIMNTRAKFIMKKYSGAAFGLTVITGGHLYPPGIFHKQVTNEMKDKMDINHEEDLDIVVEEDVWIGARSTLLRGTHLGRGCIVGAGSVVRGSVPPYAIVLGNPAKVIGFKFTLQQMLLHEEKLYSESERISLDDYKQNYKKYFIDRIKDIKYIVKL